MAMGMSLKVIGCTGLKNFFFSRVAKGFKDGGYSGSHVGSVFRKLVKQYLWSTWTKWNAFEYNKL